MKNDACTRVKGGSFDARREIRSTTTQTEVQMCSRSPHSRCSDRCCADDLRLLAFWRNSVFERFSLSKHLDFPLLPLDIHNKRLFLQYWSPRWTLFIANSHFCHVKGTIESKEGRRRRYTLCALMNHRGGGWSRHYDQGAHRRCLRGNLNKRAQARSNVLRLSQIIT